MSRHTPKCSNFSLLYPDEKCGKALAPGQSVCSACAKRAAAEYMDDLNFTAEYESRGVDIVDVLVVAAEARQGDTDGDVELPKA